jgi:hypothetical protein
VVCRGGASNDPIGFLLSKVYFPETRPRLVATGVRASQFSRSTCVASVSSGKSIHSIARTSSTSTHMRRQWAMVSMDSPPR